MMQPAIDTSARGFGFEARHLKDYIRIVWAGKWIVVSLFVVVTSLTAIVNYLSPDVFEARTLISVDTRTPSVIQNQITTAPSWFEVAHYMNAQEKVLHSRKLGEKIVRRLKLDEHPRFVGSGDAAGAFMGMVQIKPIRESTMFEISMRGPDPGQLAEWTNTLVQEYVHLNIEGNFERAQELRNVILEKLDPFRERMATSEEQLVRYKESSDQFFVEGTRTVITQQLDRLTAEYAQAQSDRVAAESRLKGVERLNAQGAALETYPEILSNPTIQNLNADRTRFEVEMSELRRTYKEGHPAVRELKAKIDELQAKIRSEVNKIVASIRTEFEIKKEREEGLLASIKSLKEEAIASEQKGLALEKIKRDYEQNKTFFEEILKRSKEADISSSIAVNNVNVIEPALPPTSPVSPRRKRNIFLAAVGSLLLGLAIVFFLDYFEQTIRYPEDIEKHLGLAVLAMIPKYTPERGRVIRELYQTLRTSLIFSRMKAGPQVVLITSSGPGEGKTTTSFNLAKILSAAGDRVVLIDCDLRRPSVHKHMGAQNIKGLTSNVFQQAPLAEILTPTDSEHLKVITSGPLPPNPPETFGRREFSALLEELKQDFDWILLDSPPVASVTDPVVLCPYADMVVCVIRYNQNDRRMISAALKALAAGRARVVGAVLNHVDVDKDLYYSSSYYHHYYQAYYSEHEPTDRPSSAADRLKAKALGGQRRVTRTTSAPRVGKSA